MSNAVHDLTNDTTVRLGHELARDLTGYERSIDDAVRQGMSLMTKLMDRHRSAGVSRVAMQPILSHISRSMATAIEANGEVVAAHLQIRKMGDRRGMKEVSWGDGLCDPRPEQPNGLQSEAA